MSQLQSLERIVRNERRVVVILIFFVSSCWPSRGHMGRSTGNSNPVMTLPAGSAKGNCLDHRFRVPPAASRQHLNSLPSKCKPNSMLLDISDRTRTDISKLTGSCGLIPSSIYSSITHQQSCLYNEWILACEYFYNYYSCSLCPKG